MTGSCRSNEEERQGRAAISGTSLKGAGRGQPRVVVYDVDPGNPYGRELAALLASKFEVEALIPVDTQWIPAGLRVRRILPAHGRAGLARQIFLQIRALAAVTRAAFIDRASVIAVMTRGWYDQIALALLAALGASIIVVAHDPAPKERLSKHLAFSRRMLWRRARTLVAHSAELADEAGAVSGRSAETAEHLPFCEYAAWARAVAPDAKSPERGGLLILGQMREDKGLNRLPAILERISEAQRNRLSLSFAGQGECGAAVAEAARLVRVTKRPSSSFLSDIEIAQELARSDVLLAPYRHVSASGSVVLALSRDLRVIAYEAGALADVVAPSGLVPLGDEKAFAETLVAALLSDRGGRARPLTEWREASLRAWLRIVLAGIG